MSYFWHCPACDEPTLKYIGPNPSGPTSDSTVRKADWETKEGDPISAKSIMPFCECGAQLEGRLEHVKLDKKAPVPLKVKRKKDKRTRKMANYMGGDVKTLEEEITSAVESQVTRSVLVGETSDGGYVNVGVSANGDIGDSKRLAAYQNDLQLQTLNQLKLLNARFEEAFQTHIKLEDVQDD